MRKRTSKKAMLSHSISFKNETARKTFEDAVLWVQDHTGQISQIRVNARSEGDHYVVEIEYTLKQKFRHSGDRS